MTRPTERLALISDVHANAVALEAVFADLAASNIERVACLGDTATLGPRPHRTLELLHERCEHFVLGNHDEYLLDAVLIEEHTRAPPVLDAVAWCRNELSPAEIHLVGDFTTGAQLELGGVSIALFHGSPQSNNHDLLAETPEAELTGKLDGTSAGILAGGHTHVQLIRQHQGRLLVNPGSVGLPFERFVAGAEPRLLPFAEYAVVEVSRGTVSVSLRRVTVDAGRLLAEARAWDCAFRELLVAQYSR